jgi:hypothetical protein
VSDWMMMGGAMCLLFVSREVCAAAVAGRRRVGVSDPTATFCPHPPARCLHCYVAVRILDAARTSRSEWAHSRSDVRVAAPLCCGGGDLKSAGLLAALMDHHPAAAARLPSHADAPPLCALAIAVRPCRVAD